MSNHGLEDNKTFDSVNKNATGAGERFADDLHPHVRYAKDGDTGVEQDGTLYSVHDPSLKSSGIPPRSTFSETTRETL